MKLFTKGDVEIKYRVLGESGPVYVLLHGFSGGPNDWGDIATGLSKKYRVIMPSLKSFFSHRRPLTFTEQIEILSDFVKTIYERKSTDQIHFLGQSYGATLSLGLRLVNNFKIGDHILLNPMPFHPFQHVIDPNVKIILLFGYIPGGISLFFKTAKGRSALEELAKVFRIGTLGDHEVKHFNDRKRQLVVKAFERFRWIDKNENWIFWENKLMDLPENAISHFIYSSHDSLYETNYYKKAATKVKARQIIEIEHHGHLLAQDKGALLLFA